MKKLYTLLCTVVICITLRAQVSSTSSFLLDYDGNDQQYATDNGFDYSGYLWNVNKRLGNADNFTLDYAIMRFDTIQFLGLNNEILFYPRYATTLTLDSFTLAFIHENHTGSNDSIRFTVFNSQSTVTTGYGTPGGSINTPTLWDTLIVTNQSIPLTASNYTFMSFNPGLTLPQGQTFGIRVDFSGDTANKFSVIAGLRDQCAAACAAEISVAGNNSGYYLNLTVQPNGTNMSGYFENGAGGATYYDCDQSGGYTPGGCENFEIQNFWMYGYMTATVDYGVVIVPQASGGCTGNSLNLWANAFGSNAANYTYQWSTTSGTLSAPTDPQTTITLAGTAATVSVTVTDGNNVQRSASYYVPASGGNGISLAITSANPLNITCASPGTITTQAGGTTSGVNYHWSTGATQPTLQVNTPGNYSVTVTNAFGCSASASSTVQFTGVTNTASFNMPATPNCQFVPRTFINTSARLNGWTSAWTFGDGTVGTTNNGTHAYANPGVYAVSLAIDSAGCTFHSNASNITILSSNNAACLNPALAVSLGNNVTTCPGSVITLNPIAINGTAPFTYNWNSTANNLSCTTCEHPQTTIMQNATYSVTVVDALNNTAAVTVNYTVNGSTNTMHLSAINQTLSCTTHNSNTQVSPNGGLAPYFYYWATGVSTNSNVAGQHDYTQPGVYVITVSDANSCISSIADTVEYRGLTISATQTVHPACEGTSTGKIKVAAASGTPPYTYLWSTNATADSIQNVPANNYDVVVTDASSCTASALFNLSPLTGWGYYVYLTGTTANCGNNATITTQINSGTAPFTFSWNTGSTAQSPVNLGAGTYNVTVTDAHGCTTTGGQNIAANCVSTISGHIFIDTNNNCIHDGGELPRSGQYVTASNGINSYYGYTDDAGWYCITVATAGTYTLSAHNYGWNYSCGSVTMCGNSSQVVTIATAGDSARNNDFTYATSGGFNMDLHPGWTSANPGFEKEYWIYCGNISGIPYSGPGTVVFSYDPNLIYQSCNPVAEHNLDAHTLTWAIDSFANTGWWDQDLRCMFMVPQTLSLNTLLHSDFRMLPMVGDCDTTNNKLMVSEVVTGSRDPNEKDVEPAGAILETDSVLTYSIHFQNNGTDSTHFIIVYDTLSQSLDPASVRTVASSHPYSKFDVMGQGVLKWTFNPLRLVDSLTNPEGSKGFIRFTVKKRHNLPIGSVISNKAHIYFDYNEPVVTNTVADTISLPSYIFEPGSSNGDNITVKAFPNPFSDYTTIVVNGLTDKFDFELYDLTGRMVKHTSSIQQSRFEVRRDELAPAVYFYRIIAGNKAAYGKLVVQ